MCGVGVGFGWLSGESGSVDYDRISRVYDLGRYGPYQETVEVLARCLNASVGSLLLDMGCGTGNYTAAMARHAGSVFGIDLSIGMIRRAKGKVDGLPLIRGDVVRLPLSSESFDGVFAVQVLHHIKKKEAFLAEAYRVLRDEGHIAIGTCSHRQIRAFWFYHCFPKGLEIDLDRIPDLDQITKMLRVGGFSEIGFQTSYSDVVVTEETPQSYLDEEYRRGISTFSYLTTSEIDSGCQRLREDIATGLVESVVKSSQQKITRHVGGTTIIHAKKPHR